jgi:alkyl hydroperoxide reductase subunit AhpC
MPVAKVGEPAPDFDLPAFDPTRPDDRSLRVKLSDYRGAWLVLFFYPADFTFVCPTREENGIAGANYPLAADHAGEVARRYGILIEEENVALRGLFIVDPQGVLHYAVIHALNIGRSTEETRRVLAALQTGGLCASDWKPGGKTLPRPEEQRRAA